MHDQEAESYSGESSYRYVDQLIKNDDPELMIISPYISNYYTKMLIKLSGKKKIRVVTSDTSLGYKDSLLNNLTGQSIKGYIKAIAFFFLLDLISIYLQFDYTTVILSLIVLILTVLAYKRHENINSNLQVKVTGKKFVHEKLYIASNMAIVGSANLTFNGMHKNVEHIEIIRAAEKIANLKKHFEEQWRSY